jgi:hypothetical protein
MIKTHVLKITNVPVFYMALRLNDLLEANLLLRPLEWVGPENLDFIGPNGTPFARCHFRAQNSRDFQ